MSHVTPDTPGHGTEGSPEASRSVLGLIRDIQAGRVAPGGLDKDSRRACVEHLIAEGYGVVEIAEILKVADRTIRRDRASIRAAHAVERGPGLVKEMVGNLVREADVAVSRIRRAVRGKEVRAADRTEAERACWAITRELVETLQKLGYLPTAPVRIEGDLSHRIALELPGYAELEVEIERLEVIQRQHGQDKETLARLGRLKNTVKRLALVEEVETLAEAEDTRKEDGNEP